MKSHTLTVNNKKYSFALKRVGKDFTHVECPAANIAQNFLNEDIPSLLIDLPNLIIAEKNYNDSQNSLIRFRVSTKDKRAIENKALAEGYDSVSSYLRDRALAN